MSTKLYVVKFNDFDYTSIIGIFDDKELAEKVTNAAVESYVDTDGYVSCTSYILNQLTEPLDIE